VSEALILASGSAARAAVLKGAGVPFQVMRPALDEEAAKASLRKEGVPPPDQAMALAELKALSVSRKERGLVLGADQMLLCEGRAFDKPANRDAAREQLLALRGRSHELLTAAAVALEGAVIWRALTRPKLTMRAFSEDFLEDYLDAVGPAVCASVGAYQIEGRGVQLFSRIEGEWFSILGLPMLELLVFLRERGVVRP